MIIFDHVCLSFLLISDPDLVSFGVCDLLNPAVLFKRKRVS
uniref:Uncharacterized protein n=1 Tax=Rhizophora mucronata TaxID=61149 RepID=A0A2P2P8V7_RHIMU